MRFVCVMVLCGTLLWAYIVSRFCEMATNADPGNTEFTQLLDGLNAYLGAHEIPRAMARRLREYLHPQKPNIPQRHMEAAIPCLSPALQAELILHVNQPWIHRAWFLRDLEPACLVRLAREMSLQIFAPGELAPLGKVAQVLDAKREVERRRRR